MQAFWSVGYDGASVDTMCRVSNMSRASLYQAYGGKEGLFLATIAHYAETRLTHVMAALGPHGSLKDDLTAFYNEVVRLATADPKTPGCLISCVLADVAGTTRPSAPSWTDGLPRSNTGWRNVSGMTAGRTAPPYRPLRQRALRRRRRAA